MTFIEAWEQAMLEVGVSEADLQRRRDAACMAVPVTDEMLAAQIKPGTERTAVDALKELYTMMRDNRELLEPIFRQFMASRNARN